MSIAALLLFPVALWTDRLQDDRAPVRQEHAALSARAPEDEHAANHTRGGADVRRAAPWLDIVDAFRPASSRQVRIQRRIIIRIVPLSATARPRAAGDARTLVPMRIVERPVAGCVPLDGIAGISADRGSRIRLHLHSRQVLSMRFDDSCPAEAFYSGFYVERRSDGLLCPARDTIQSRSGVRCAVGRFSRLVAERAD